MKVNYLLILAFYAHLYKNNYCIVLKTNVRLAGGEIIGNE